MILEKPPEQSCEDGIRGQSARDMGADQTSLWRVEQHEQLAYQARFSLALAGVIVAARSSSRDTFRQREGITEDDRLLLSLVSGLGEGEKLTFVYAGGHASPFSWRIIGEAGSTESASAAHQRLQNVRHAVLTALESRRSSYRFDMVQHKLAGFEPECIHNTWIGEIQPTGTCVKQVRTRLGFNSAEPPSNTDLSAVCLPHYTRERVQAFASIADLLASSSIPVRIALTLEPYRLSKMQKDALQSALNTIRDACPNDGPPTHLEGTANAWLKALAGYRITCKTWSARRISEAFLLMLGGEIYPGPVIVTRRKATDARAIKAPFALSIPVSNTMDLRNCIPCSFSLPALFPRPETLISLGARRFFNRKKPVLPRTGLLLGRIRDGEPDQDVKLCPQERCRHFYILGATGTGKSTLLYNLIMQDIHHGKGVALVDPHGDLYQQVVASLPAERVSDVVLLDTCDRQRAVGMNLLECHGPHIDIQRNYVINECIKMLEKLYDMRNVAGPIFEQFFRSALLLVMEDSGECATLTDLPVVFENPAYRKALVERSSNPMLKNFWKMAEEVRGDHGLGSMGPYITSKLNLFVQSAMIRPIIAQSKSTIDFRKIMDEGRILLVNLSRGALGELDAQLLGMVVLAKLVGTAMGRVNQPAARRKPFMVYIDEFQHFMTDTTASLLSESRKFGLCLTLANQNLAQLSVGFGNQKLLDSVLCNVGSLALFRLGAPDAAKLSVYTQPTFDAEDLQNLPNFHATARLLTPSGPTPPFVFETYRPDTQRSPSTVRKQIKAEQHRYSTDIREIEEAVRRRRAAVAAPTG